jgi:hypothetical protein
MQSFGGGQTSSQQCQFQEPSQPQHSRTNKLYFQGPSYVRAPTARNPPPKAHPFSLCLPLVDDGPQCCGGDSSYNEPRAPACPCQEVTHCYSPFTSRAHEYPSSSLIRLRFRIA